MLKYFNILFCLLVSELGVAQSCPQVNATTLQGLDEKIENGTKILFFASWCQSCVDKIKNAKPENSVLVGVFDTQENIEKSYAFLKVNIPCLYGGDHVAALYGVKYLPFELDKKPNKF